MHPSGKAGILVIIPNGQQIVGISGDESKYSKMAQQNSQ
jgi:hypothetical protein